MIIVEIRPICDCQKNFHKKKNLLISSPIEYVKNRYRDQTDV